MAQDSLPTPAEQAFITYPTATAPPRELAGQRDVVINERGQESLVALVIIIS